MAKLLSANQFQAVLELMNKQTIFTSPDSTKGVSIHDRLKHVAETTSPVVQQNLLQGVLADVNDLTFTDEAEQEQLKKIKADLACLMAESRGTLDSNTEDFKILSTAVAGWGNNHEVVQLLAQAQNAETSADQKEKLEAIIRTVTSYADSANDQEKVNNAEVLAAVAAVLKEVDRVAGAARDTAATVVTDSRVTDLSAASAATSATVSPVSSATSSRSTSSINVGAPPASTVPAAAVASVPVASTTATAASAATTPVTTANFGATAPTAANKLSDILSRLSGNTLKVEDPKQSGESHTISRVSDGAHVADINTTTGQVTTTSHAKPDEQKKVFQAAMQHFSKDGTLEIKSVNQEGVGAMAGALKAFLSDVGNKGLLDRGTLNLKFADTPEMKQMLKSVMSDSYSATLLKQAMLRNHVQVEDSMKSLFVDVPSVSHQSQSTANTGGSGTAVRNTMQKHGSVTGTDHSVAPPTP